MNPELEKWIDEASKGLEPLAREKIIEQITEHYQDAVLGYHSSGLDEKEIHSRAMLDLGKPRSANRRFRRIFLTVAGYKIVQNAINPAQSFRRDHLIPNIFWVFVVLSIFRSILNEISLISKVNFFICTVVIIYLCLDVIIRREKFDENYKIGIIRTKNQSFSWVSLLLFASLNFAGIFRLADSHTNYTMLVLGFIMQISSFVIMLSSGINLTIKLIRRARALTK